MARLTKAQWRTLDEFRRDYHRFCDADPVSPDFSERMETAGYIELRSVTDDDLEDAFAYERGIERGGSLWDLTDLGRTALAEGEGGENG